MMRGLAIASYLLCAVSAADEKPPRERMTELFMVAAYAIEYARKCLELYVAADSATACFRAHMAQLCHALDRTILLAKANTTMSRTTRRSVMDNLMPSSGICKRAMADLDNGSPLAVQSAVRRIGTIGEHIMAAGDSLKKHQDDRRKESGGMTWRR